ncbi:hypothetical protein ACFL59_02680, partial [Planctomycetota bacterium]
ALSSTSSPSSKAHVDNVPPGRFWFRLVGGEIEPHVAEPGAPDDLAAGPPDDSLGPGGEGPPPAIEPPEADPEILGVYAQPRALLEGEEVELKARVLDGSGQTAKFRVYKLGEADPVAELEAPVAGDVATAKWKVADPTGGGEIDGRQYADFDVEVEVADDVFRTEGVPEFRGLTEPDAPSR